MKTTSPVIGSDGVSRLNFEPSKPASERVALLKIEGSYNARLAKKKPPTAAIVTVDHGALFVDTPTIANLFGRRHSDVLKSVRVLVDSGTFDERHLAQINYTDSGGRTQPAYRLSKRDALILMPFLGGAKAAQGQARLVDEFLRMEAELARLSRRRADPLLLAAKRDRSAAARLMTDELQQQRAAIGKETFPHHFSNEHKLCAFVLTGIFCDLNDDEMDVEDHRKLTKIRRLNTRLIMAGKTYTERKTALVDAFPLSPEHEHYLASTA